MIPFFADTINIFKRSDVVTELGLILLITEWSPCKCDCYITNTTYFIFYQNQCDIVSQFPNIILFKDKTKFDY